MIFLNSEVFESSTVEICNDAQVLLMIGKRGHAPFRHFIHVAQIREKILPGAIHRRKVVICARRRRFFEFRHASYSIFARGVVRIIV